MKPPKLDTPPAKAASPSTAASQAKEDWTLDELADRMTEGLVKNLNANVTKDNQEK